MTALYALGFLFVVCCLGAQNGNEYPEEAINTKNSPQHKCPDNHKLPQGVEYTVNCTYYCPHTSVDGGKPDTAYYGYTADGSPCKTLVKGGFNSSGAFTPASYQSGTCNNRTCQVVPRT